MYPSSVVQTGVKSLGCENRIAQPSPIHSWKRTVPCVVSAVKSGASSFIRSDIVHLLHFFRYQNIRHTMETGSASTEYSSILRHALRCCQVETELPAVEESKSARTGL